MSDVMRKMILCPHCNRTAYFNIWNSINTKTHPETLGLVRNLSLFRFRCPYCRQTTTINYSFLYHQMENFLFIYYVPENEDMEPIQQILKTMQDAPQPDTVPDNAARPEETLLVNALANYRYRIVRTHEDFLEKLAVFDAGLDDRLVEITKVMLGAQAEQQLAEYGFHVEGAAFLLNRETGEMQLVFRDRNSSRTASVSFDRHVTNIYNRLLDQYSAVLDGPHKGDTVIDRKWAAGIVEEAGTGESHNNGGPGRN